MLARLRIKPVKATAGLDFPCLRQLDADNAGLSPNDAATADAGIEDRVLMPHHATPRWHHNIVMKPRTWNLDDREESQRAATSRSSLLFEHDLRPKRLRVCRERKSVHTFVLLDRVRPGKADRVVAQSRQYDVDAAGFDHPLQAVVAIFPPSFAGRIGARHVAHTILDRVELGEGRRHGRSLTEPRMPV